MRELTWWEELARTVEHKYAVGTPMAALLVGVAACLALAAVGIASHAWFKGRGKHVSLRSATSHLLGFVWLLPVFAVLLLVASPLLYLMTPTRVETAHGTVPHSREATVATSATATAESHSPWHVESAAHPESSMVHLESSRPVAKIAFWPILLIACLALAAVSTSALVWRKGRQHRSVTSHLLGFVWLLPVFAVLLLVGMPLLNSQWQTARQVAIMNAETHEERIKQRRMYEHSRYYSRSALTAAATRKTVPATALPDEKSLPRPEWVDAGEVAEGGDRMLVVSGGQFPEPEQARLSALGEAVKAVRGDVSLPGCWTLSPALVQNDAVKQTYVEPIARSTGVNDFVVYRAYHQVEISDEVRAAATASWRDQTVSGRLWIIGGLLGFVVLSLGTAATYLRLDAITEGNYRRRLKLASVSLLVAGGLALSVLLPMA